MRLILTLLLGTCALPAIAQAAIISEMITGTIASGTGQYGLLGAANDGVDFTGKSISLAFTYDTSQGNIGNRATSSQYTSDIAGAMTITMTLDGIVRSRDTVVGGYTVLSSIYAAKGHDPSVGHALLGEVDGVDYAGESFALALTSTWLTGELDSQAALDTALQLLSDVGAQSVALYDANNNAAQFFFTTNSAPTAVPEPGSLLLLAGFSVATHALRRRRA